ncbi:MAG: trypsin-like peptidase domain-containing protein [Thermoanaerobaculia bacterium]
MAVPGFHALVFLLAASAPVVETGPAVFGAPAPRPPAAAEMVAPARPLPASARHVLPPLSPAERAVLQSRDARASKLRRKAPAIRVGLSRALPGGIGFDSLPADLTPGASRAFGGGLLERAVDGRLTWTAAFASPGAGALRLHLRDPRLPAGGRAWVFSASGEAHGPYGFDGGTRPEGFWTNTVFSEEVFLRVELPVSGGPAVLAVDALMHLEHPAFAPGAAARASGTLRSKSQDCFVDASCVTPAEFPNLEEASRAVAQLTFVDDGSAFLCTGALLKTTTSSFVPYLLTANHCFANQPAATSLEAIWNYRTASCDGPFPNPSLFPRTLGSTLLATGEATDFTFVQLWQDPPDGSVFLGWTTTDYSHAGGTILYRLSHPDGDPQFYTRHAVSATPTPVDCIDAPQGDVVYSKDVVGGTGLGSSGSPVYLEDLRVVGQEFRLLRLQHRGRLRRHRELHARRLLPPHVSVGRGLARPVRSVRGRLHDAVPERRALPRPGRLDAVGGRQRPRHGRAADGGLRVLLVLRRRQHRARREGARRLRDPAGELLGLRGRADQRGRRADGGRPGGRKHADVHEPARNAVSSAPGYGRVRVPVTATRPSR